MSPSNSITFFSRLSTTQLWLRRGFALILAIALIMLANLHGQWHPGAQDLVEWRWAVVACWLLGIGLSFLPPTRLPELLQRFYFLPALVGTNALYLWLLWANHGELDYFLFNLLMLGATYVGIRFLPLSLLAGTTYGLLIIVILLNTPDPSSSPGLSLSFTLATIMVFGLIRFYRDVQSFQMYFFNRMMGSRVDMVLLLKKDGEIIYASVNDPSKVLWDPDRLGKLNLFDLIHKEYTEVVRNSMDLMLQDRQPSMRINFRIADFRLRYHMVEVELVRLTNSLGQGHIALSGTMIESDQNVTEKLQQRSDELQTFIYRTAHDFQGPLATLAGLRPLIEAEVSDTMALRYIDMMFSSIHRLNEAMDRQLELAVIIKDDLPEKERLEFEEIALQVIDEVKKSPGLEDTQIQLDLPRYIPFFGDKDLLRIILRNLVANAARYRKGKGTEHEVRLSLDTVEDQYLIKVEDNGTGILPTCQDRVFEMFFRGTNQSVGSGLGLYIVKNSVEKLKGKVILAKTGEEGSTFSVLLPLFEK